MQTLIRCFQPAACVLAVLAFFCTAPAVQARQVVPVFDSELKCLALTVYFEAAGEPLEGQYAVAHVVLNRAQHAAFPRSVCQVVRQGGAKRGCQFSWWCDGRSDVPQSGWRWRVAQQVARDSLDGRSADPTRGALYFHRADLGRLRWTRSLTPRARIGEHVYFR